MIPEDDELAGDAGHLLALRSFPWLAQLSVADLAALTAIFDERLIRRRTVMVRPGQPVPAVYFILDGQVKVSRAAREEVVSQGPIGFLELLAGEPQKLAAAAMTEVVALVANPDGILDLIEENFGILADGLASLAGDLLSRASARDDDFWLRAPTKPLAIAGSGPLDIAEIMIQLSGSVSLSRSRLESAAELARIAVEERLPEGQPMWQRGDAGPDSWLILDGEVELTNARGKRLRAGAGHELGAIEALAKAPRWYDAVAAKPVRALRLPVADLLDVIEDQRDVGMLLMRELAADILRLDDGAPR